MATNQLPRFLLPRWPTHANGILKLQPRSHILPPTKRHLRMPPRWKASSSQSEQTVLEQPTKYNPPSHPTGPRPAKLSHTPLPAKPHKDERTSYPGLMPAKGTVAHWILHSPKLHGLTAVSVLAFLALYVMYRSFMEKEEAAKLAFWDWQHPILSAKSFVAAYRESDRINTARIMEKRRQLSEDMERKAHYRYVVEGRTGASSEGFGSWGVRRTKQDEDFGWGIVIDGKRIDQYIADKEREKREKRELANGGASEERKPVVVLEEKAQPTDDRKKTWW